MNLRNTLAVTLLVLSSFAGAVKAQTNYNFTLTFGVPSQLTPSAAWATYGSYYLYGLSGTGVDANNDGTLSSLNVTSLQIMNGINNNIYAITGATATSATVGFNPSVYQTYGGKNVYATTAGPSSLSDLTFIANGVNYSFSTYSGTMGVTALVSPPSGTYVDLVGSGVRPNILLPASYIGAVGVSCSINCFGGAPEIDGSLAPKVGFLLGCLFLMFGRKRQDSEPLMTA